MHSAPALCFAQQKQFCRLSTIYASLRPDIVFHFITLTLLAAWTGLINELDLLTLRFRLNS